MRHAKDELVFIVWVMQSTRAEQWLLFSAKLKFRLIAPIALGVTKRGKREKEDEPTKAGPRGNFTRLHVELGFRLLLLLSRSLSLSNRDEPSSHINNR